MPSSTPYRKSRPSRISSPIVRTATPTTTSTSSGWTEPALVEERPSYEDHGGAAFGVLEDMQALGQRPSAKVRARVKGDPSLRKTLGKQTGMTHDGLDSQEGTPSLETPRSASVVQDVPIIPPIPDDEKDDDYEPRASKRSSRIRQSRGASTPSEAPKAIATPVTRIVKASETPSEEPALPPTDMQPQSSGRPYEFGSMASIVDGAVQRSREVGNPELGAAIKHVYLESATNARALYLLRAILHQNATPEEAKEFRRELSRAKKFLRAHGREIFGEDYSSIMKGAKRGQSPSEPSAKQPSDRPELVARPSIEGGAPAPKLKISIRAPKQQTPAEPSMSQVNGRASGSRPRSTSGASDSSLSSLTSQEDDHMELDQTANLQVAVPKNNLKRTSAEAEIFTDERDKALAAKKQKLAQTVYKEPQPQKQHTESHIRTSTNRPRALRQQTLNFAVAPPVNGAVNGRARRDLSESPLSDLSPPPSPQVATPRAPTAVRSATQKKAKTKQS